MQEQVLEEIPKTVHVATPEFSHGEAIPDEFTCEGENVSPPLSLGNLPRRARALAILVEDPDAPGGTFTHWLVWNWPLDESVVPRGVDPRTVGAVQGENGFGEVGYGGPCPPEGTHRYFFRALALDAPLELDEGAGAEAFNRAVDGHVLAWGEVVGTYTR